MMEKKRRISGTVLLAAALGIGMLMSVSTNAADVVEAEAEWALDTTQGSIDAPQGSALGKNLPALVDLPSAATAAADQLDALEERRRQGHNPLQIGFDRTVPTQTINFTLDDALTGGPVKGAEYLAVEGSDVVWSGRIRVAEAFAFRIHLEDVEFPSSARLWVYNEAGEYLGPFGAKQIDANGGLWLPPLEGSVIYIEIRISAADLERGSRVRFMLHQISQLVSFMEGSAEDGGPWSDPELWTDCSIDISCEGAAPFDIDAYARSVARLLYADDGGGSWLCSGGLVNDRVPSPSFIPYLLTANHCFDSETEADSLVAYFDYRSSTCDGSPPSLGSVPQVSGADLLATNAGSDFTFVELDTKPAGRYYLGWTTGAPTAGQMLYSISHPSGQKAHYNTVSFNATGGITCGGLPRPNFLYSSVTTGATTGGSSGSPLYSSTGQIVGQLYGSCHFDPWDSCTYTSYNAVHGAFATTYPSVETWLNDLGTELTVTRSGAGSGTVASSPSGINCGSTCTFPYRTNTLVTLTATPSAGSQFVGWSGSCTGTNPSVNVLMSANKTCNAQFETGCVDDQYEEDDICFGTFMTAGSSQVHKHCDEDWIYFNSEIGHTYRIETSNIVGDTTLSLQLNCGDEIAFDDDGGSEPLASRIDWTADSNASADIRIRQFGSSYADGEGYTITVTDITLPDLVVASLTHSPTNPTTADTITFVATVQNIGSGTAGSSVLEFGIGGENPRPTYPVPSLAPSATFQVTRTAQLAVAQGYTNTATADVTSVVAESNESNNVTTDVYTVTPDINGPWTLSLTKSGTGSGTVTSIPAGINCGADCSELYSDGTNISLLATPDAGSVFAGWSGWCSWATLPSIGFTISQDTSCDVRFDPDPTTGPWQMIYASPSSVGVQPGGPAQVDVMYDVSDADATLTGIGIRVHYDSSLLTYSHLSNSLVFGRLFDPGLVVAEVDSSDYDGDAATDRFISLAWVDFGGSWPGSLPELLASVNFNTSGGFSGSTQVNFSASDLAAGYSLNAISATVFEQPCNLDVDGNNAYGALTDGVLIVRYLFGFTGAQLTDGAIGIGATRTDATSIINYLNGCPAMLDVDGNGSPGALTDGVLIVRYLFGFTGVQLTAGAVGGGCTRCDAASIIAFLDLYTPILSLTSEQQGATVRGSAGEHLVSSQVGRPSSNRDGKAYPVQVDYATTNLSHTGFGLRMHFDSTMLSLTGLSDIFPTGMLQHQVQDDTLDYDGDPKTDRFIIIAWMDHQGSWPGTDQAQLFTATFQMGKGRASGATTIRYSTAGVAAGTDVYFEPVHIGPGSRSNSQ